MDENLGLIGRKSCSSKGNVLESSMGISDSKIPSIRTDNVLLLKYCPEGDTGSSVVSSSLYFVLICRFKSIFLNYLEIEFDNMNGNIMYVRFSKVY